jgi:nucleoside diphosphate kinase
MKEWSLGIIKPDAVHRSQEILSIIEKNGLKVVLQKNFALVKRFLGKFTRKLAKKIIFHPLSIS